MRIGLRVTTSGLSIASPLQYLIARSSKSESVPWFALSKCDIRHTGAVRLRGWVGQLRTLCHMDADSRPSVALSRQETRRQRANQIGLEGLGTASIGRSQRRLRATEATSCSRGSAKDSTPGSRLNDALAPMGKSKNRSSAAEAVNLRRSTPWPLPRLRESDRVAAV